MTKNYRNLFIIIEGIDNVGKGTLISNIKNHYNNYTLHQLHYSNVKLSPDKTEKYSNKLYTEMFYLMKEISLIEKSGIICDRSHIGELVYGPIYRNYPGTYVLDIEKQYHDCFFWDDLILITLIDKAENVIERDDGLSFTTELEKKNDEIRAFVQAHKQSTIKNKLLLDISKHNKQQALSKVVEFIN